MKKFFELKSWEFTWEMTNAFLCLAFASRFLLAPDVATSDPLFRGFERIVPSDHFWGGVFVVIASALAAIAVNQDLLARLLVRPFMMLWWVWVAAFLADANINLLSTRIIMAIAAASVVEFALFVRFEGQRLVRG